MARHHKQSGFALFIMAIAILGIGLVSSQYLFSSLVTNKSTQQEQVILNQLKEQINNWYRNTNVADLFQSGVTPDSFRTLMSRQGIIIPNKYDIQIAGPLSLQDNDALSVYSANENALVFYKILLKKTEPNYDTNMDATGAIVEVRNDPNNAPVYAVVDGFMIEREKYALSAKKLEKVAKAFATYKQNMIDYLDPLRTKTINYVDYLTSTFAITYDVNGFSPIPNAILLAVGLGSADVIDAWGGNIEFCPQNCGGNKDANAIVIRYKLPQSGSVSLITY